MFCIFSSSCALPYIKMQENVREMDAELMSSTRHDLPLVNYYHLFVRIMSQAWGAVTIGFDGEEFYFRASTYYCM